METANAFAILGPDLIRDLDEIGRIFTNTGLATWGLCLRIGAAFDKAGGDKKKERAAKRYLASTYRLGRAQVGNHLKVYKLMQLVEHSEETLELLPWSVAHLIRKRHKDDYEGAAKELADLLDGDKSLIKQRLDSIKAASKEQRERTFWRVLTKMVDVDIRKAVEPLTEEQVARLKWQVKQAVEAFGHINPY